MNVVISQPMYFPWVGMLEQMRLADVYVHYDDVQFSKGSFTNRVQIKRPKGMDWLTIPLFDLHLGTTIEGATVDDRRSWRARHLDLVREAFEESPFGADAVEIARATLDGASRHLTDVLFAGMNALADYFGIRPKRIVRSSTLGVGGRSTDRVVAIVRELGGTTYITGHGAKNYLDHEAFEREGIEVRYVDYEKRPYPQRFGPFTPFVTALDLVANMGRAGAEKIGSGSVPWKEFVTR